VLRIQWVSGRKHKRKLIKQPVKDIRSFVFTQRHQINLTNGKINNINKLMINKINK
jgi:hypothetical protein